MKPIFILNYLCELKSRVCVRVYYNVHHQLSDPCRNARPALAKIRLSPHTNGEHIQDVLALQPANQHNNSCEESSRQDKYKPSVYCSLMWTRAQSAQTKLVTGLAIKIHQFFHCQSIDPLVQWRDSASRVAQSYQQWGTHAGTPWTRTQDTPQAKRNHWEDKESVRRVRAQEGASKHPYDGSYVTLVISFSGTNSKWPIKRGIRIFRKNLYFFYINSLTYYNKGVQGQLFPQEIHALL